MRIKVLGTAAATGMPLTFCNCHVCKMSRELGGRNIRKRSSILINDELLIDLGPDSMNACNMYGVDTGKIRFLLQTHSHSDHFDAGHFVTRWSEYATKNLTHLSIVCSKSTADDMNHWIQENENMDLYSKKWMEYLDYDLHIVRHGDEIQLGDYVIRAIDSKHDERAEALIYIISHKEKNILYGTDLLELTKEAWNIIKDYKLDVVFLDQTYGEGKNAGGHLDAGMVKKYVQEMKALNITDENTFVFATHISHEGNNIHEIMEQEAAPYGYHIAYDGMFLDL